MVKKVRKGFLSKIYNLFNRRDLEKNIILELKQDKEYFRERMENTEEELKKAASILEKQRENSKKEIRDLKQQLEKLKSELKSKEEEIESIKKQIDQEKNKELEKSEKDKIIEEEKRKMYLENLSKKEKEFFDLYQKEKPITQEKFCEIIGINLPYLKQIIIRVKSKGLEMEFEE